MKFSKAVEGMILQESGGGKSESTIQVYRYGLKKLLSYLGDGEIESITKEDLQRFFRYLRTDTSLCEASIAVVWRGVRIMFRWAAAELGTERIDKDIPCPKSVSKTVRPYTEKEVYQLLKSVKESGRNYARDNAVIMLLLDTGMRIGELSRLQISDYDEEKKQVMIRPKGTGHKSFPRIVPLSDQTRSALWKYLATRGSTYDNDRLFLTNDGRPVNRDSMRKMCARAGKRIGMRNVGPHRFRHTFITQYLRNGGDTLTLKSITGIKSDKILQGYAEISQADLAVRHRASSPVTNWKI